MTAGLLALSLFALVPLGACHKEDPPPPAPAPVGVPGQPGVPLETTSARDLCKKKYATNCAMPCQARAIQTEKDENRLKAAKDKCMIHCLEQAETACPRPR